MSASKAVYLFLAVVGLVSTWYYNLQFMSQFDGAFNIANFINHATVNAASSSLSWDLFVGAIAGFIWILRECRRLGIRHSWLFLVLGCGVAFAFAFPLFLYVREGKLEANDGLTGNR